LLRPAEGPLDGRGVRLEDAGYGAEGMALRQQLAGPGRIDVMDPRAA
jgi:hypothetical protein